jgi:signal transduction histidine kinase
MMLATMAHDLRSPLARIQAAIELRARPDEDWAPVLCDVQEIDHLIGQCIDYVRDGQDEPTLMISVDALLRALVRVPEDAAVELDLAAPQALPLRRQLLSRAVRNLVDNARRHGSAPIRLNTRLEADAVLLTVEDQGPGIDPRHWERLLKPFEQGARQGRACAAGSAGLGLAIVQRAARQHGGGLSMRPATTGSPFSISLRLPLS